MTGADMRTPHPMDAPKRKAGETLGAMLLSEINVAYYQRLMHDARDAVLLRRFASFCDSTRAGWAKGDLTPR